MQLTIRKTRYVFYFRGFKFFLIKNWYAFRWGQKGVVYGDMIYLVDVGAITFGYVTQIQP